jgi:hypothetical protein
MGPERIYVDPQVGATVGAWSLDQLTNDDIVYVQESRLVASEEENAELRSKVSDLEEARAEWAKELAEANAEINLLLEDM